MLQAGDTLTFTFSYSALISGQTINCTTPQFAFSIAPSGGTVAPAGQPPGATTPVQLAQLLNQIPINQPLTAPPQPVLPSSLPQPPSFVMPNQQMFPVQPLSAANDPNANLMINGGGFPSNSLPPLPPSSAPNANGLGTQSNVCPALAYEHGVGPSQRYVHRRQSSQRIGLNLINLRSFSCFAVEAVPYRSKQRKH